MGTYPKVHDIHKVYLSIQITIQTAAVPSNCLNPLWLCEFEVGHAYRKSQMANARFSYTMRKRKQKPPTTDQIAHWLRNGWGGLSGKPEGHSLGRRDTLADKRNVPDANVSKL